MELVDIADNPLPPGGVIAAVTAGAVRLRVARWSPAAAPAGTIVVCPGRSEFIEKYAEVVAELLDRRLAVVVIDWRGQGGSTRLLRDPRRGHVDSFDAYRDDLDAVITQVLRPHCPAPYFALGHSMGGAILMDHAAHRGAVFDRLVLSAPMLAIWGLRFPRGARLVAASVVAGGLGGAYVPGGSGESWMTRPFAGNGLTSDPGRYGAFSALADAAPHLLIGAPTFGWLHAAFHVMGRLMRQTTCARVTTPVLAFACGADQVVETRATERFVAHLPNGRVLVIRNAMHEILMEADAYRAQFWAAFDRFIPGGTR